MDDSKIFIKMCEKAEEIQALKREEKHKNTGKWKAGDYWTDIFGSRVFIVCEFTDAWADEPYYLHHPTECIWLPTQAQLQEMLDDRFSNRYAYVLAGKFGNEAYDLGLDSKASMGQLWLAFVEKENYNKVWNGEDWVESE